MKLKFKIIYSIIFVTLCCLCVSAQNPRTVVRFDNDELKIYYEVDDYARLFDHHRLVFVNKTNNRMRVTYKVNYNYYGLLNGARASDVYNYNKTRTLYINSQGTNIDSFVEPDEKDWDNFMKIANKIGYRIMNSTPSDPAQMIVNFQGFELVNYGVEDKSYRTRY